MPLTALGDTEEFGNTCRFLLEEDQFIVCGIITIASPPFRGVFGTRPEVPGSVADLDAGVLEQIDFEEFYAVYTDQERYNAWGALAGELGDGTVSIRGTNAGRVPKRRRLDAKWRIEQDLLSLVDAVSELLDDSKRELPAQGVRMGWIVELALRALSRLEVRGRDSAGLTLLAWPRQHPQPEEPGSGSGSSTTHHTLVRRSADSTGAVALTYKVAEEVGALGYNDSVLRGLIGSDRGFHELAASDLGYVLAVGHTRWASTGAISTVNAHPVDGSVAAKTGDAESGPVPRDRTLAVVNGDVDNYHALLRELFDSSDYMLPAAVTTDSKIIPVLVELSTCLNLEDKVRDAAGRIKGSLASVVARLDAPGSLWSIAKGSGQSLYAGIAGDTCILSSEVYGCLELTRSYFPLTGEQSASGGGSDTVVYQVRFDGTTPVFYDVSSSQAKKIDPPTKLAEITTRDVDRRGYRHYFRKELEEAIDSVNQTIVGRYVRTASSVENPEVEFPSLYSGDVSGLVQRLTEKRIRQFVFIGQGSAHVAGLAGAHFINEHASPAGLRADAVTAGEFSAHRLRADLSDVCVVAVSQSGTTTDTNRAARLARARGATVIGIVNRRDSTLTEISDVVIYTSDGRDIEMAVASTKAFYSQVVACFLLALHCGLVTRALVPTQVCAALAEAERLPDVMRECFRRDEEISNIARSTATRRRHWSVLGSGTSRIAAQEIRIKMSELCYKTSSVDYLEDKKHIDLSAEPLIVVPVFELRDDLVEDVAKEVAIFAAHNAAAVVFCDRGGKRYKELTPHVVEVPPIGFSLGVVSSALIGHLFAYHTAMATEETADRLRAIRRLLVDAQANPGSQAGAPSPALQNGEVRDLLLDMATGGLDAVWPAAVASRLAVALAWLSGDAQDEPLSWLPVQPGSDAGNQVPPLEWASAVIDSTIGDTTRPIDSVRHQAKTVTVGTTRAGYSAGSATAKALMAMGIALDDVPVRVQYLLGLLDEALEATPGGVRYRVEGAGEVAGPERRLNLRVVQKIGSSADRPSRFDDGSPVSGTKAIAVRRRQPLLVRGVRDRVPILVFPLLQNGRPVEVILLHLEFKKETSADLRERLLDALPQRREALQIVLEEDKGRPVSTAEISRLPLESLLFGTPDQAIAIHSAGD